jgi:bifunctional non-homologous end joining protein LigD
MHAPTVPATDRPRRRTPTRPARRGAPVVVEGQAVTHPDRVVDARTGATKLDLALYYARAARAMAPHLKGRPVAVVRAPDGLAGERFFQKHAPPRAWPGVRRLPASLDPGRAPAMAIDGLEGLLGAVQFNAIEFHTWSARAASIERPDRLVFDLDPGEGVPWPEVREAARDVRALLEGAGLCALLKTSGGRGLHVVAPIAPGPSWTTVREAARALVERLAERCPRRFVAQPGEARRVGRIFADYLRNGRGATTVCAWSLRARPGLGVSVPVAWDELDALRGGAHWTIDTVGERLAAPDPWTGRGRRALAPALKRLGIAVARGGA